MSAKRRELRGITWQHTRGFVPMVATAQRFSELHPEVSIRWEMRSLQAFADQPIEKLARDFDLLVIDHPFVGRGSRGDVLLPMDALLDAQFLEEQRTNAVGASYESYVWAGQIWALPTDTATPVSGARLDLLQRHGAEKPTNWSELMVLAVSGLVSLPAVPIDSLMNFYMLCVALGEEPFSAEDTVVSQETGGRALAMLRELVNACGAQCLKRNPIAVWEGMSSSDETAYCPFAYGYSNYAREGYARFPIDFGGLIRLDDGAALRSTLGGAGLAISKHTQNPSVAAAYAQFVASESVQCGIYFESGGQPGFRKAWTDAEINRRSGTFFAKTLEVLDTAYLRPRFDGYLTFQDEASEVVHEYLSRGGGERTALEKMNRILARAHRQAKEVST
jgi:multiple sugar transport system substrate-binding protein